MARYGRDHKLAVHWYRDAAEAGLLEAQFNLGYLYERGLGLKADGVQAAVWYRRAAMQGQVQAYRSLGMLYAIGRLVRVTMLMPYLALSCKRQGRRGLEAITALIRRRGGRMRSAKLLYCATTGTHSVNEVQYLPRDVRLLRRLKCRDRPRYCLSANLRKRRWPLNSVVRPAA